MGAVGLLQKTELVIRLCLSLCSSVTDVWRIASGITALKISSHLTFAFDLRMLTIIDLLFFSRHLPGTQFFFFFTQTDKENILVLDRLGIHRHGLLKPL